MSTCTAVFLQGHSLSPSAVDSGMEELGGEGRRAWLVRTFGSISRGRKQGTETKLKVTTTAPRGLSFPLSKFSKTLSSLPVAVIGCLYWVTFSFHFYFLVTWINCEIIEKRNGFLLYINTDYNGIGKLQYLFVQKEIAIIVHYWLYIM